MLCVGILVAFSAASLHMSHFHEVAGVGIELLYGNLIHLKSKDFEVARAP